MEQARRRGVSPDALDPAEIISEDPDVRKESGRIASDLIEEYLRICGKGGRVALPTYHAKDLLPKSPEKYKAVVAALHARYLDAVAKCYGTNSPASLVRLFSVGFGPNGYTPLPTEDTKSISEYTQPQFAAAKKYGYRPIVEATTSLDRFKTAWRDASRLGIEEVDIGLAFDSHGHLAADGTSLAVIADLVARNPEKIKTRVVLGANCGSLTGIEKAARLNPGVLEFAYANSVDADDLDHLNDLDNGTVHHHKKPVTVEELARIAEEQGFKTVSLCCGFCPEDLEKLKGVFKTGS